MIEPHDHDDPTPTPDQDDPAAKLRAMVPAGFEQHGGQFFAVPTVEPAVYAGMRDDEPHDLDPEQLLGLLLEGSRDAGEVGERVLLLAFLDDKVYGRPRSLRELALWLDCSPTTAKSRLDRVRAIIAKDFARSLDKPRHK